MVNLGPWAVPDMYIHCGEPAGTHEWGNRASDKWQSCSTCGIVRRADDKNKPCKGPVAITLRGNAPFPEAATDPWEEQGCD